MRHYIVGFLLGAWDTLWRAALLMLAFSAVYLLLQLIVYGRVSW